MSRSWKFVIITAFAVIVLAVVGIRWLLGNTWQHVTIARDVTHITAALHADGQVDYIGALNEKYGDGVTPKNNAVIPLVALLDPAYLAPGYADDLATALGAPPRSATEPAPARFEYYMNFRLHKLGHRADDSVQSQWDEDASDRSKSAWKSADYPEITEWLRAN